MVTRYRVSFTSNFNCIGYQAERNLGTEWIWVSGSVSSNEDVTTVPVSPNGKGVLFSAVK